MPSHDPESVVVDRLLEALLVELATRLLKLAAVVVLGAIMTVLDDRPKSRSESTCGIASRR
jgi:hypothetical protein